ncbi:hypothetical protein B0T24DRAFT_599884 [Lasiosphaeria ovina]|uniref:Uncharacterized protein n=1 Tax=Lasiosphaeria ovina TaxID=92902 RepID=A0AAE0JRZ4_9PEZI|nr:hypothetical protein B0T24DRAFT_599884 [Lasiosphaeria ovina]
MADYNSMKVPELKKLLNERGLTSYKLAIKPTLLFASRTMMRSNPNLRKLPPTRRMLPLKMRWTMTTMTIPASARTRKIMYSDYQEGRRCARCGCPCRFPDRCSHLYLASDCQEHRTPATSTSTSATKTTAKAVDSVVNAPAPAPESKKTAEAATAAPVTAASEAAAPPRKTKPRNKARHHFHSTAPAAHQCQDRGREARFGITTDAEAETETDEAKKAARARANLCKLHYENPWMRQRKEKRRREETSI